MCGISGFIGSFDSSVLEKINRLQAHRGPDDAGVWFDPSLGVGLAHRRLSIIDLSPAGHQPMWDLKEQAAITFNGEIYNYRELRQGLKADGYQFMSSTDTEVILNLYLRDGFNFIDKLNGIFAFAIWDNRQKGLLLARDSFGVKPLYYAETKNGFVFASEIKALVQIPDLDTSVDGEALLYYVSYCYAPFPHTPLKAVKKLPPGQAAWVTQDGLKKKWSFNRQPYEQSISDSDPKSAMEELRFYLDQAGTSANGGRCAGWGIPFRGTRFQRNSGLCQ